ncbi:DegT/DnrJ/EryC1/StrS family aminotransferase [Pseudidiomarina insulisalsae]|uniref:UDP-4-amino-4, 6-dideoxy-N-acetyl-beta-L-altrosamine transaminase n=1 Tax=Pseudidiomarina insulisalsae TaxID=575789 RepID=A0A432YP12_9GAMM|nr:DegT/DnrJ/EryC1/StrS family aminotransferase [Pseudidiomarina insulisalsae]RUO62648.1 UDP-4-amino-4,6-dideoxy-N-acetyl-beta-L-altrosamine transaminase [Pseudidiomarina insulisalsae]
MSTTNFLPFALPEIGEEEIAEVVDSLRSGWVTTGPKAKKFEESFSEFLGGEVHSLAVNSATSGLHLALEALGVGKGDEVIIPSYTFTATAEVIRYLGGVPVFVDVNEHDFNISVDAIRKAITSQTKVIMPVHFAGQACDMDEIIQLAREHELKVVEDAAHALPTTYKGRLIGQLDTDVSVFSFYANKTMTTGEGGMLVTKNEEILARCKIMRLHGISRDAFDRYTSSKPAWFYEIVAPGFKYNMPDISAAIGIHQLARLPRFLERRVEIAEKYAQSLSDLPLTLPKQYRSDDQHAWHLYPVLLEPEANITRDDFIIKMAEYGVGCSVHFIPLHLQPYWRDQYSLKRQDFKVSQSLFEREVSLPLYTKMTDSDVEKVINAVKSILTI